MGLKYKIPRLISQTLFFSLMFVIPILNIYEIYFITGTYYAINFGGLGVSDPVVILQSIFASGQITSPLLFSAIFPVLVALVFGRVWCGWFCPYLFVTERLDSLRRIVSKKSSLDSTRSVDKTGGTFNANLLRFSVLVAGTAIAGILGIPLLNYLSAPGILSTEAMIFVKERAVSIEIGFLIILFVLQLTILPRFWCRLFCPTGTLLSVIRMPRTLTVEYVGKRPSSPCCGENSCSKVCPMGLKPYLESTDLLCVNCGKCVDECKFDRLKFGGLGSVPQSVLPKTPLNRDSTNSL